MELTSKKYNISNSLTHSILLILGGFAITYNIAIALHELGHVIAYLIEGGQIGEFVLNPFSWSWANGKNLNNRIFDLWGGVTFGQIFALMPLFFLLKKRPVLYVFLSKLLAACAFLVNGIYLTFGTVFHFGDGGTLAYLGVNSSLIMIIGSVYLLISFFFWSDLQRHLGINKSTSFKIRLLIIVMGIAPYMILIFLYNLIHNSRQIVMWGGLAATGIVATFLISMTGHLWARYVKKPGNTDSIPQLNGWKLLVAGLLFVLAEFFVFGTPPNPF